MTNLKMADVLEDIADRIEHDYPNSAEELRALLAAPVVERQEPVAPHVVGYMPDSPDGDPLITLESHQDYVAELQASVERLTKSCIEKDACISEMDRIGSATIARLTADIERLNTSQPAPVAPVAMVNLRNFANAMIDIALEGCDADGPQIQELAVEHGLLKPEQRTERCGDTCSCAEYADFPVECFRKVKELNQ